MRAAGERKAFLGIMGALTSLATLGCTWQLRRYKESRNRWDTVNKELENFTPTELAGYDAKNYPWIRGSLSDWEYRLVKFTGYYKQERFFVRSARGGRAGYAVFAPFVTAVEDPEGKINPTSEYGLMVNLGWVPKDNKDDIEMSHDPYPCIKAVGLHELVGLVHKGETQEAKKDQISFHEEGIHQFVDLPLMTKFFNFFNYEGASQAYVERMIGTFDDEDSEALYPVPATKDTFLKPYLTPGKHLDYATFWAGATMIGLGSILAFTLKR